MDLKSQLSSLIELQAIDTQIYALRQEKEAKPKEIEALKADFELKKQSLANLEKVFLDLQKQKNEKELELTTKEGGAKKFQSQLFSLKTNKEYQTMLQQIDDVKADASIIEDRILTLLDQIDKTKNEIEHEKKRFQEEEKNINEQVNKIEGRIKEIEDSLSQLDTQRKQIFPNIEKKIISQYERILANREGLAIVRVKNNTCLGCNMHVPPQVINLIKMYERIVICEICNRILYTDD